MWLDCLAMDNVEATRNTLRSHRGTWPDIAQSAGLSYWWLLKFAQGQIKEPGAAKMEKLRTELALRRPKARAA